MNGPCHRVDKASHRTMAMGYGAAQQHPQAALEPLHQSGAANAVTDSGAETSEPVFSVHRPTRRNLVLAAAGAAVLLVGATFHTQSGGSSSKATTSLNAKVSKTTAVPQPQPHPQPQLSPVCSCTTGTCRVKGEWTQTTSTAAAAILPPLFWPPSPPSSPP